MELETFEQDATFLDASNELGLDVGSNLRWLMSILASLAMIFGGVLPYYPQYREIKRTENAEGFSTYVCLALLAANTLRIIFWFGKRFELPLLIQSVVIIFAMFLMIELCVRTKFNNNVSTHKQQTFIDFNLSSFWQWTDFLSYVECTAAFTVVSGMLMYYFMHSKLFVEGIGYLSLTTESLLATPQLIKNFQSKSTAGMSRLMVLMWTGGDVFKTGYFIIKDAPFQFWLCGLTQVTIDLLILGQVVLYKSRIYKKVQTLTTIA
jgi:uncharacterized protein with PQ loop repeat